MPARARRALFQSIEAPHNLTGVNAGEVEGVHRLTTANGQPAVAAYRSEDGGPYSAWSIDVLTVRGDRIAAVTSFIGAEHFPPFGLPTELG